MLWASTISPSMSPEETVLRPPQSWLLHIFCDTRGLFVSAPQIQGGNMAELLEYVWRSSDQSDLVAK